MLSLKKTPEHRIAEDNIQTPPIPEDLLLWPITKPPHRTIRSMRQLEENTLPETNVAPEIGPSQKDVYLPTIHFQGLC